jgi:hypothetical protein
MDWELGNMNGDVDAFDQGWNSYNSGLSMTENPYYFGTESYGDWESGWISASEGEAETYE